MLDTTFNFAEQNAAVLENALACERIIGRRLTDSEYSYIVRFAASIRRARLAVSK